MKNKSARKYFMTLLAMALLVVCIISTASAATLKSSLYFNNVQTYAAKTSTFDIGYDVTLKGKATKNSGSLANTWYMKFSSRNSPNMYTDGIVRSWITSVSVSSNTYQAVNRYPDDGLISGSILCYQH
jgi:hypothetical protein